MRCSDCCPGPRFSLFLAIVACGIGYFVLTSKPSSAQKNEPAKKYGAGASLEGKRLFPDDNPWNQDISHEPIDPNSDKLIASIGRDKPLHPDFGTVYQGAPNGIPYVVVAGEQAKVPMTFRYADESDAGP